LGHNITYDETIHGYKDPNDESAPFVVGSRKKELPKEHEKIDVAGGPSYWNNQ
jgi:hypothetical protein